MKKRINPIVKNRSRKENDVSWKKCSRHSQFHCNKHSGASSIGRMVALTQIIHNVLNIFDHTRFATHISYFFLTMAVIVVANSGKLVQAAIIVAQIAHSDIHKVWAIYTAASTITSEAITKSPILATSLVIFKSIHLEVSLAHGMLLLKAIIINNISNNDTKISLILLIQNCKINSQSKMFAFTNASKATHTNKYMKFLIFGTDTSIASSLGDSFLMIRYPLYHTSNASREIHSRNATCWSHSIMKIRAVTVNKNAQSL